MTTKDELTPLKQLGKGAGTQRSELAGQIKALDAEIRELESTQTRSREAYTALVGELRTMKKALDAKREMLSTRAGELQSLREQLTVKRGERAVLFKRLPR